MEKKSWQDENSKKPKKKTFSSRSTLTHMYDNDKILYLHTKAKANKFSHEN